MRRPRYECEGCGEECFEDDLCDTCSSCAECCDCDELFDADELGLDPEEDVRLKYHEEE